MPATRRGLSLRIAPAIRNRGTLGGNLATPIPPRSCPWSPWRWTRPWCCRAALASAASAQATSSTARSDRGARRRAAHRGALPDPAGGPGLRLRRVQPAPRRFRDRRRRRHAQLADGVCRAVRLGYAGVGPHALSRGGGRGCAGRSAATPESFARRRRPRQSTCARAATCTPTRRTGAIWCAR